MRLLDMRFCSVARAVTVAGLVAGSAGILASGARADVPEYWERETFHTARSTVASLFEDKKSSDSSASEERPDPPRSPRQSGASRLGGPKVEEADATPRRRTRSRRSKGVRVASLGNSYVPQPKRERGISGGGGIRWLASAGCLDGAVRSVLAQVASRFGSVTVNSTCRSKSHNARVGGASRSKHLTGDAADFRVHGNWRAAAAYLRSGGGRIGGYKHYGGGLFHIDNGPHRSW